MGISNAGAGGGDREDVDSVDPHVHVAVRGLFGIEPALRRRPAGHLPRVSVRLARGEHPHARRELRVPARGRPRDVPHPHAAAVVKRVRANLTGPEVVTPAETESVVTVPLGPPAPPPKPAKEPTILAEQQPPTEADTGGR